MKIYIKCSAFILCFFTISLLFSISARADNAAFYISKTLQSNPSFFSEPDESGQVASSLAISISVDRLSAYVCLNYDGISYHGCLNGTAELQDTGAMHGYFGVYSGFLTTVNDLNEVYVDISTVFNKADMYAIVSMGTLSENSPTNLTLYGDYTVEMAKLSSAYCKKETINQGCADACEIGTATTTNLPLGDSISTSSTIVDVGIVRRGTFYSKSNGYNLFSVVVDCPRNLINGNELNVYTSVYTTVDSFINYLRNVEGYNNSTKGIALNATPYSVDIEIGGYHQDFILESEDCLPKPGDTTVEIPIYVDIEAELLPPDIDVEIHTVPFLIGSISFETSKYVNANQSLPWDQIASWTIMDGRWDEFTLEYSDTSEAALYTKTVLRHSGAVTQSVFRTVSISASVKYLVNIQGTTGPAAYVITAKEYSGALSIIVYPATS